MVMVNRYQLTLHCVLLGTQLGMVVCMVEAAIIARAQGFLSINCYRSTLSVVDVAAGTVFSCGHRFLPQLTVNTPAVVLLPVINGYPCGSVVCMGATQALPKPVLPAFSEGME